MITSTNGRALIQSHEGLKLNAYTDSAGVWTIGYGNTFYPNGKKVLKGDVITKDYANKIFPIVLSKFENGVSKLVKSNISQNQFDSLVSLAYNIGLGAFAKSSVLKKVNQNPNDKTIVESFKKWSTAGGKQLKGLLKRRIAEASHYFSDHKKDVKIVSGSGVLLFGSLFLIYYLYSSNS